ncbi:Cro/CI family transcriptional regulator [Undibacterium sp. RTI2.1]|uniref:Cro/CI family transcriptional regulator n=1 Tax=unclassified Undibacterium TaxID=2630295 RepID=UPI002AB4D039|nr:MULTISPECIES: Cro/CI family transcriptional regulator [unclassified Undibacterium]MDY7537661.1 Cro/CI family transcriptional regulator [Undibacterium sp. 5I1]MEB0029263.1 Cro/CI family transcriptional regulator [Undibacterium sp. RTI2.1]MEB0115571.1 Cro/CI family transcriptional regulator [Undibacterium sp. RTI2.2]MEB0256398.1 Cro/CI family transcriptional regulator [Undibacterium sp. 5I1]
MENLLDSKIIDKLGGTSAVAKIFDISPPSVSDWKKTGIPKARRMYLELKYPDLFSTTQPSDNCSLSPVVQ